jgi:hypothetical protein
MNMQILYDSDFHLWIQEHILLLKASRFSEIDTAHLVEELEDMGKRDKRELKSRLRVLIAHLLKWQYQPEGRSTSWESSINGQRLEIIFLLKDMPSLKNLIDSAIMEIYADAVEWASDETHMPQNVFPVQCPFTQEQLLDKKFYSDDSID